jgi:hypothetical protein
MRHTSVRLTEGMDIALKQLQQLEGLSYSATLHRALEAGLTVLHERLCQPEVRPVIEPTPTGLRITVAGRSYFVSAIAPATGKPVAFSGQLTELGRHPRAKPAETAKSCYDAATGLVDVRALMAAANADLSEFY